MPKEKMSFFFGRFFFDVFWFYLFIIYGGYDEKNHFYNNSPFLFGWMYE